MGIDPDEDAVDDAGETVVVDRSAPAEAAAPEEHTVVVERPGRHQGVPPAEEHTVVVDRSTSAGPTLSEEHTVVVDRSAPQGEHTVVVDRSAPVPRKVPTALGEVPRRGRRTALTRAPGEEGTNRTATLAPGPGAVTNYPLRSIAPAPAPSAPLVLGADATRAPAPAMPSVGRHSRRVALVTLSVAVVACAVSVVGLIGIALLVFQH